MLGLFVVTLIASVLATNVVVLTDANFDEVTQVTSGEGSWLIEFYAPWCGHCKKLEPVWTELPTTFEDKGITTKVAKVDATVHAATAARFQVKGFPTILYFAHGQVSKYQGARGASNFVEFVQAAQHVTEAAPIPAALTAEELAAHEKERAAKKKRPPQPKGSHKASSGERSYVMELGVNDFDSTVSKSSKQGRPMMVYFYAPWCGHCKRLAPTWDAIAQDSKDGKINAVVAKVDATVHTLMGARFSIRGFPTIRYIVDNMVYDYGGKRDKDSLIAFLGSDWSSLEGYPVPQAGLLDQVTSSMQTIAGDLEKAWRETRLMLAFIFVFGACSGFLLASVLNMCCPPPPRYVYAPRPAARAPASTAASSPAAIPAATPADKATEKPKTE